MSDITEVGIKQSLVDEIANLELYYNMLSSFVSGNDYDKLIVGQAIQAFKGSLSKASENVHKLYDLKVQQANIPWDVLFDSLDYVSSLFAKLDEGLTLAGGSPSPKQKEAFRLILSMSQEQIAQVLSYLATLKESLK